MHCIGINSSVLFVYSSWWYCQEGIIITSPLYHKWGNCILKRAIILLYLSQFGFCISQKPNSCMILESIRCKTLTSGGKALLSGCRTSCQSKFLHPWSWSPDPKMIMPNTNKNTFGTLCSSITCALFKSYQIFSKHRSRSHPLISL